MPFVTVDIHKVIEEEKQKDPAFRKAWDESREEYRLLGEMMAIRKKNHITQAELAKMTGQRQQNISEVEKHERRISLRNYCNLLKAMGYKLEVVKADDFAEEAKDLGTKQKAMAI